MKKKKKAEMDQETAGRLLAEGAILVVLDVPIGTDFGVDMKSWETGNKFRGVKMIPPGLHFVHYSAVGSFGNLAPRIGFFHFFKKAEMLVRRWDPEKEEVTAEGISEELISRLEGNIWELDQFLGPYPYDIYESWKMLSNKITEPLVRMLIPVSGYIKSALELSAPAATDARGSKDVKLGESYKRKLDSEVSSKSPPTESGEPNGRVSAKTSAACSSNDAVVTEDRPRPRKRLSRPLTQEEREEALLPQLKALPGTELRLTKFPDCNYPEGSTPAEITFHSMDLSYALETMLARHDTDIDIVGELQFSFICFMVGQSLEAFDHWKRLVVLICESEQAISKHQEMFDIFLWALEPQLWEIQEDFLADIVSNNNAVYRSLRTLFRNISASHNNLDGRFKTRVGRFRDRLTEKFMWDFSNLEVEEYDDLPVLVETDLL